MKVLHIIDTFWLGGAQTLLKSYFEAERENFDIHLFSLRRTLPSISVEHKNVSCYRSHSRYSPGPLRALTNIIKKRDIDVLHCHLPRSQVFGYLVKRLFQPNIILVFHEHGDIFEKGVLLPALLRFFQHHVDQFVACSKAVKKELIVRAGIPAWKIEVVYNFVDTEKFARAELSNYNHPEKNTWGIKPDDFVVGFAGRLVERKGWREFVKIAKRFKSEGIAGQPGRRVKFLMAGIGPDAENMKKLINNYSLNDSVTYVGYITNMKSFYALLNCLVIPSYWEGHPITQLESLALGIPLVCSNGPGLTEVATDNSDVLYVESGEIEMFYDKICLVASDSELRDKLSSMGIATARSFSLPVFTASLNQVHQHSSLIKRFRRKTIDIVT
jgi:glycosyltransferase involved in cell wall biosynthesis